MFHFTSHSEPPTAFEIKETRAALKARRNRLFKYSGLSDLGHGLLYFTLYFYGLLSGYAVLTAIAVATVCAITLASVTRHNLSGSDKFAISAIAMGVTAAIPTVLVFLMKQAIPASMVAGVGGGSIVIFGATLGRQVRLVMTGLEDLKTFQDDNAANQELLIMSRRFSQIAQYREEAGRILRPNLTYGELKAMRRWAQEQTTSRGRA